MPIEVDANLKIPSLTIKAPNQPDRKIDNGGVRFIRRIVLEKLPKVGDTVQLATRFGEPFDATVNRVDWDEGKNLFVVACTYARRSISANEHDMLITDPDWRANHLP